jgi:hypothetical protein
MAKQLAITDGTNYAYVAVSPGLSVADTGVNTVVVSDGHLDITVTTTASGENDFIADVQEALRAANGTTKGNIGDGYVFTVASTYVASFAAAAA